MLMPHWPTPLLCIKLRTQLLYFYMATVTSFAIIMTLPIGSRFEEWDEELSEDRLGGDNDWIVKWLKIIEINKLYNHNEICALVSYFSITTNTCNTTIISLCQKPMPNPILISLSCYNPCHSLQSLFCVPVHSRIHLSLPTEILIWPLWLFTESYNPDRSFPRITLPIIMLSLTGQLFL